MVGARLGYHVQHAYRGPRRDLELLLADRNSLADSDRCDRLRIRPPDGVPPLPRAVGHRFDRSSYVA
jgi:hypothetical protein